MWIECTKKIANIETVTTKISDSRSWAWVRWGVNIASKWWPRRASSMRGIHPIPLLQFRSPSRARRNGRPLPEQDWSDHVLRDFMCLLVWWLVYIRSCGRQVCYGCCVVCVFNFYTVWYKDIITKYIIISDLSRSLCLKKVFYWL